MAFLVFMSLFCGSVVAPVLAHSGGDSFVHANEVIDVHDEQLSSDINVVKKDPAGKGTGSPAAQVPHHHCMAATAVGDYHFNIIAFLALEMVTPASAAEMISFLSAPPTQPPSA